jgi:hypothetical protein
VNAAADAVLAELRARSRWLLLFDNAEAAHDLVPWLPGGTAGHVLITTRTGGWDEIAARPVEVDVFARPESAAVLLVIHSIQRFGVPAPSSRRRNAGWPDVLGLEFESAPYVLSSVLTFCDMTTSPDGEPVPLDRRLAEIHNHYSSGHLVSRSTQRATPMPTACGRRQAG